MNNYEVEENVPDTPQVTLDNYDAAVKDLKLDVKGIKQWRADTEMFLGALFEQAQQAGDEQQRPDGGHVRRPVLRELRRQRRDRRRSWRGRGRRDISYIPASSGAR